MKTKVKPQIYDEVEISAAVQANFSERKIPKGTVGTIVECYEDPEGYAVDLALPNKKLVGDFAYENVILEPNQFEVIRADSKEPLLKKVEKLNGTPKREIARALGFVSKTKTGQERVKLAAFMNALLKAKGVEFGVDSKRDRRGGRSASYRIQVQQNGNLLIGAAYTRELDLEPGTEFEIQLGRNHIKLVKIQGLHSS